MTTYAIGDIQGCFHAFQHLLEKINFDRSRDCLWLVGDLINRGSGSLEVLRWCEAHQTCIRVVLGNHDLHALVVAHGLVRPHRGDTLDALLEAKEANDLLYWLRHQPLIVEENNHLMVHAGLLPQWTTSQAVGFAREVESALQSNDYMHFLAAMYGNFPCQWHDALEGMDRLRLMTNAMTRLRICNVLGEMEFSFKGELDDIPENYMPWFDVPTRASLDTTIIFGHWSALGLQHRHNVFALDTGCLWGGHLTAMALDTKEMTQVPYHAKDQPILNGFKKA